MRAALIEHPALSAQLLERLAQSPDLEIAAAIGERLGGDATLQLALAASPSAWTRLPVMDLESASPAALDRCLGPGLSEREALEVARRVARHPRLGDLPEATLERLFAASDPTLLAALAANPALPPPRLLRLAASAREDVRAAVAANPSAPGGVLLALAKDADAQVRESARRHPRYRALPLWRRLFGGSGPEK